PYDADDADVILRSSDYIDFPVHKGILGMCSSVFRTMFTLPQAALAVDNADVDEGGLPIVVVSEDSRTLDSLLPFIYPSIPTPYPVSFDVVDRVIAAAQKYEMTAVSSFARSLLRNQCRSDLAYDHPFRAYVSACKYGFAEEALEAARHSLERRMDFEEYRPYLSTLASGSTLHMLSVYRGRCRDAAIA
ncbi:hypothetical protein FA95DRAFT_1468496, partial [Auriscalpium vulgare]